jgi:hypothetical protein
VGKKNNIIEINGKRYDAHTGEPLDGPAVAERVTMPVTDVARPSRVAVAPAPVRATAPAQAAPRALSTTKTRVHEAIKAKNATRQPQHSRTLMRSTVSKPEQTLKRHAKAQSHTDALLDQPAARLERKASVHRLDDRRLQHASQIAKSQAVSRFSRPHGPAPNPPVHLPTRAPKPVDFPVSHLSALHAPARELHALDELVEHALEQATSHLELPTISTKRRLFWRTSA